MPSPDPSRRTALQLAATAGALACLPTAAWGADASIPATGDEVPALAPFQRWIETFMAEHRVPGGQLAIARGGKVVYSRGFGYADREQKTPVEPTSLFRIASISKPITA